LKLIFSVFSVIFLICAVNFAIFNVRRFHSCFYSVFYLTSNIVCFLTNGGFYDHKTGNIRRDPAAHSADPGTGKSEAAGD